MWDPWASEWSRRLGKTEVASRTEVTSAVSAEVGKVAGRPALDWAEPLLQAAVAIRESGEELVADCSFSLSWPVRLTTLLVGAGPFLFAMRGGLAAGCHPNALGPAVAMVVLLTVAARIVARLHVARIVRRAVRRARSARQPLPTARTLD